MKPVALRRLRSPIRLCSRGSWPRRRRSSKATQAQVAEPRRVARMQAARERRLTLDPDQLACARRIDESSVAVEVAWEVRVWTER